jgi:hypothetical protein
MISSGHLRAVHLRRDDVLAESARQRLVAQCRVAQPGASGDRRALPGRRCAAGRLVRAVFAPRGLTRA